MCFGVKITLKNTRIWNIKIKMYLDVQQGEHLNKWKRLDIFHKSENVLK